MVLRVSHLSKSFGAVQALTDVSLHLEEGEVHALVGENGAGKSTLIKIITGAHAPDSGYVEICGQRMTESNPIVSRRMGVAVVYQQPTLFPDLSVAENLAIGLEKPRSWRWIDWSERRRRARQLLDRIGADIAPDSMARDLSMPQQQLVEIARAVGQQARVLIMDEPTASLNAREVEHLLNLVRSLARDGVGILYVSHRLEELPLIARRVTVLRDGGWVATRELSDCSSDEMIRLMVGREVKAVFPQCSQSMGAERFVVSGLTSYEAGVQDITFSVRSGEILGLGGLMGAGRTELARTLFGITPADRGSITLDGTAVTIDSPRAAIGLGVAYVPEDRRNHGVIGEMPVDANISLSLLDTHSSPTSAAPNNLSGPVGGINRRFERQLADNSVKQLQIKTSSTGAPVQSLSGGNQQKVALARWLAIGPKVLILDEPTQGVDVGAKAEIYRLIAELAQQGIAILLISSEMNELLGLCHRIAVMRNGTISGTLTRQEATAERIMSLSLPESSAA